MDRLILEDQCGELQAKISHVNPTFPQILPEGCFGLILIGNCFWGAGEDATRGLKTSPKYPRCLNCSWQKISPETEKILKNICAPMANIGHRDGYVDLTAAHYEKLHNQVLQILFQDKNIDMVLQILAPSAFLDQKLLVEEIAAACQSQQGGKTFLNAVTFGEFAREARQGLEDAGMPTFEYPDMLARFAGNMATDVAFRKSNSEQTGSPKYKPNPKSRPAKVILSASRRGRVSLLEPEAYKACHK